MEVSEMPEPVTSWHIFTWLWDRKDEIARRVTDIYRWFRNEGRSDGRGILIIGPGGTGKTTLARILSGQFDWLTDTPWEYAESIGIERYRLRDDPSVEILVPPGQQHRQESTWPAILADIIAGRYRGIIFVASYGFHTLSVNSYKDHHLYRGNVKEFTAAYSADRRAEELRLVRRLSTALCGLSAKTWFVSVVSKQDLWWPERQSVEAHYRQGEHASTLTKVMQVVGERQFRHEPFFGSLVIANFMTSEHEVLKRNSEGYDHRKQIESVRRLL